jgi:RNA-directed DNA polymerase
MPHFLGLATIFGYVCITMDEPEWYHKKAYAHFDLPLSAKNAVAIVSDSDRVARHGFHPFISFDIKLRRYKSKNGVATIKKKIRPIRMSSHLDGHIFAYYAWILSRKYEDLIEKNPLGKCVLAYRKGLGSNIKFAKAAFDEVERRGNCTAIAMDLESFFDCLDHQFLKTQWCQLLGVSTLPSDHYAVFRAMTRYARVDRDRCFAALGIEDRPPRPICSPADFRVMIRGGGLIETHRENYGIPQGSPMSAVLSNIYMTPFDKEMVQLSYAIKGYYRRYCDDILWIFDNDDEMLVQNAVDVALEKMGSHIRVNKSKNIISHFNFSGLKENDPPLQYLGFTYDGERRLIRSSTLSKYWRKVVYGVRAAKNRARKSAASGGSAQMFKRKIYRKFTHLGRSNFLSYVRRSYNIMEDISITNQMKNHWERIQKEIKK